MLHAILFKEWTMTYRPQDLINDWYASIDIKQKAHRVASLRLNVYHHALGISTILLGLTAAAILLVGMENSQLRLIAGSLALFAATLCGIQTFYSHAKRSALHSATASQLGQLRREIEELEKLPPKYLKAQTEIFVQMGQRLETIDQTAPQLTKLGCSCAVQRRTFCMAVKG